MTPGMIAGQVAGVDMTPEEKRHQIVAVAVQIEGLSSELGDLADAMPVMENLELIALAHELAATSLRIKIIRSTVPDASEGGT